jgi:hypothetical protein
MKKIRAVKSCATVPLKGPESQILNLIIHSYALAPLSPGAQPGVAAAAAHHGVVRRGSLHSHRSSP